MPKFDFSYKPVLPNRGSTHATPASMLYDLHYTKLGIYERWNWARFARLARFLSLTPWELGSLAMISHAQIDSFERAGLLPPTSRAAALVLTILEATVLKDYVDDIITQPIPTHAPQNSSQKV